MVVVKVGIAYEALKQENLVPLGISYFINKLIYHFIFICNKGFAFWDIADEGAASIGRPNEPVWLAKGLNSFMHIRESEIS